MTFRQCPSVLTINYAALALLQMGNRIAMERAFFSQWGRIVKDGRTQCGILKFQRISSPETYESSLLNSAPLNSSDSNGNGIERVVAPYEANITGDIFSAVSTGDSSTGRIIDPKNKLLVVDFRFRGEPMKGSEVFMCFLDALATATDHDPREVGATIDSYSGTFDTWLHVMHLDSPRYYQEGLNWGTMIRVLQLIWEQAIMGNSPDRRGLKPQYQGMEFEVFKAGCEDRCRGSLVSRGQIGGFVEIEASLKAFVSLGFNIGEICGFFVVDIPRRIILLPWRMAKFLVWTWRDECLQRRQPSEKGIPKFTWETSSCIGLVIEFTELSVLSKRSLLSVEAISVLPCL